MPHLFAASLDSPIATEVPLLSRHPVLPLLVSAVVSGACGAAGSPGSRAARDAPLEDVVAIVPRARLAEELRLDANAEDFSVVSRIHVGPRGEIVVPQPQDAQVRIYDTAGSHVATVGRRGGGPGEFEGISTIGWVADTLWVYDIRQRRVTFVGPDGAVLRTSALHDREVRDTVSDAVLGTSQNFTPWIIRPDGSILGEARVPGPPDHASEFPPRATLLVPADGPARLLAYPPSYEDPRWMMEIDGWGRFIPFTTRPFTAYSAENGSMATLHTEATSENGGTLLLALYRFGIDAAPSASAPVRPAFERLLPYRGEPIPRSARDSALAAFIPEPGRPTEGPPELPRRFQALARDRMPAVYPPVAGLRLGLDDTIWLDLRPTDEGRLSLMLDGAGEPIASVLVPANVVIRQSSRTHVWATERDGFGLASVVRYRISGVD